MRMKVLFQQHINNAGQATPFLSGGARTSRVHNSRRVVMSEVEEITRVMETDEEFVTWLRSLPADKKVGDPRLANNCPELRFLRAQGFHVLQVGLGEVITRDLEQIPCLWIQQFQVELLKKCGKRLREVTVQECLSALRPDEQSPTA